MTGASTLDASDDAAAPTYAPTFTAVYDEILQPTCAGVFCHGAAETGSLSMATKAAAYGGSVNVTAHGPDCGDAGLVIVDPGDPDASLLYRKVTSPPCGSKMPPEYVPYLDARQTAQIAEWITLGAQDD